MMREAPIRLRCEFLHNPLGLAVTRPRLSWWVNDPRPAELQSAYQIQAASQPDALRAGMPDRWDSGHVSGARTAGVVWGGRPLRARDRVWWRVRCYDSDGLPGPWSEPAHFEIGLLHPADWRGRWIAAPLAGTPTTSVPVPLLWRDFELAEAPASARLYVAALGTARVRINGADVEDREPLAPWTDLDHRVPYRVFDVGRLLSAGPNRLAVLLADGDYCGRTAGAPRQRHGLQPALCVQLELIMGTPASGEPAHRTLVISDSSWQWRPSWVIGADRDGGEEIDGRQWQADWGTWARGEFGAPVIERVLPPLPRFAPLWPAVRVQSEHQPAVALPPPGMDGLRLIDFGRRLLGRVRVRLRAPAGSVLEARYGDGPSAADITWQPGVDRYTARGHGHEWFEPTFALHAFRWVALSGTASGAEIETVLAREIGIDGPSAGSFESDRPSWQAWFDEGARISRTGLSLGPVAGLGVADRRACGADVAAIFMGASASLDVAALCGGWLDTIADQLEQHGRIGACLPAATGSMPEADGDHLGAWIPCLWRHYRSTDDRRLLQRLAPLVRVDIESWQGPRGSALAGELTDVAWFVFRCLVAARIAAILGHQDDLARFEGLGMAARQTFRHRFVSPDGLLISEDQLGYLLALALDLLEGPQRPVALGRLIAQLRADDFRPRLTPSHLPLLLDVLCLEGRSDLALQVLQHPPMAEAPASAAIAGWLQRMVLGLDVDDDLAPERNAYRRARFQPHPPLALDGPERDIPCRVQGHLDTVHGRYHGGWVLSRTELRVHLVVPGNCSARVLLPDASESLVGSGEHHFAVPLVHTATDAGPGAVRPDLRSVAGQA